MTGRADLQKILNSLPYRNWAMTHTIDAGKVQSEWEGKRRPMPTSGYAAGLVGLIRRFPAATVPPLENGSTYQGIYSQPGALVRNPRGGVEDIARYKSEGIRWLLLNLEHTPDEWATIRARCDANGIKWGYWFHCLTPAHLTWLLNDSFGTDLVGINVEQELASTLGPSVIARIIADNPTTAETSLYLLGWVQNGVDCRPIGDLPAFLEIFPQDAPVLLNTETGKVKWLDCRNHAKELGLKHPLQLAGCYGAGKPSWYNKPYSLYTLDDAAPTLSSWL